MKKTLKRVSALVLIVLVCIGLCSCTYIDDLREHTAVYTDDSENELIFKGEKYKILPSGEGIEPIMSNSVKGTLSHKEVPLLLADNFGSSMYFDEVRHVIRCSKSRWYAREDVYDNYKTALTDRELSRFCLIGETFDGMTVNVLNEKIRSGISEALSKAPLGEEETEKLMKRITNLASLYTCDKNELIYNSTDIWIVSDPQGNIYLERDNKYSYAVPTESDDSAADTDFNGSFESDPESADIAQDGFSQYPSYYPLPEDIAEELGIALGMLSDTFVKWW